MATPAQDDDDFFALGLDSLQAIQMRSEILQSIDIGGKKLGQQVVFEHPTINRLSGFLLNLCTGGDAEGEPSIIQQMENLVMKYAARLPSRATRSSIVGLPFSDGCQCP